VNIKNFKLFLAHFSNRYLEAHSGYAPVSLYVNQYKMVCKGAIILNLDNDYQGWITLFKGD